MDNADCFSSVISLGSECESAFRIDDYFSTPRQSSPFDWLVTPTESLLRVLEDDGARLGQRFRPMHGGATVQCAEYGVLYHHEFPRHEGIVEFSEAAARNCRDKLQHKFRSMKAAMSRGRTLFLCGGLATNVPHDEYADRELPASVLNTITKELQRIGGRDDFVMAVIVRNGMYKGRRYQETLNLDAPLDPRVKLFPCEITDQWPPGGDPIYFASVFRGLGLAPDHLSPEEGKSDRPEFC